MIPKIAQARAFNALSQRRHEDAAAIARGNLSKVAQDDALNAARFRQILGLALIGQGNVQAGSRVCEQALAAMAELDDPDSVLDARLAALQGRVLRGDKGGAKSLFVAMEPSLAAKPETKWRALSWRSRLDTAFRDPARGAFEDLRRLWGETAFRGYLSRPDLQESSMSLFAVNSR